ncbi:ATP-grasp domain-containing protein [Brachybacterium sp. FME24]|uniref:ATP-grasp domain-containing protein n=1 Tax=Brachybacterium sp. FME24 TaxID=2742605 RepID=UPI0018670A34|nr:ATP-grasp domain-containing protein [Brachybacterium sp. FME24]
MGAPTIVIGSAGRRLYLIDWFREAFAALGLDGSVVVTENDPWSSAASYGDVARQLPRYSDPAYAVELLDLVEDLRPRLYVSVNDYELMHLHVRSDLAEQLRSRGVLVPGVSPRWQLDCADKLRMAHQLDEIGVRTPATVRGGDREAITAMADQTEEVVVKHRFGSGSSGLAIVPARAAMAAVETAARSAPATGRDLEPDDRVIVQPRVLGVEHGVDIVGDLRDAGALRAVLARRKLRMRAGETDQAVTVDPAPFRRNAELIARAAGLTGLVDVDMFLDDDEGATVIDINPRFGGGYPFVHLAGADVPRYYLTQAFGIEDDEAWRDYATGVVSAKYESVRVTGHVD